MNKKGFTLAEVLITLTIIGVVAALTLPSLTTSVSKNQIGPKLAKAINTLENANKMALQQYEARDLESLAKQLNETDPQYTRILEHQVAGSLDSSNSKVFRSKDGFKFMMQNNGVPTDPQNGKSELTNRYTYRHYMMLIDINGDQKPNYGGQDQFRVIIDTGGAVIPSGGTEYARYRNGSPQSCNTKTTENGANCTGNIVDNGWKVIYK